MTSETLYVFTFKSLKGDRLFNLEESIVYCSVFVWHNIEIDLNKIHNDIFFLNVHKNFERGHNRIPVLNERTTPADECFERILLQLSNKQKHPIVKYEIKLI